MQSDAQARHCEHRRLIEIGVVFVLFSIFISAFFVLAKGREEKPAELVVPSAITKEAR